MSKIKLAAALVFALAATSLPAAAQMGGMSAPAPSREDPTEAFNAGVAALNANNFDEAIRQLRDARRSAPSNGQINYALGLAYIGAGNKPEAKSSLARAIRDDNAPPGAWMQLGLVSLELGDRDTALTQQTALQRMLTRCDAACGDARRSQIQAAETRLTQALAVQ